MLGLVEFASNSADEPYEEPTPKGLTWIQWITRGLILCTPLVLVAYITILITCPANLVVGRETIIICALGMIGAGLGVVGARLLIISSDRHWFFGLGIAFVIAAFQILQTLVRTAKLPPLSQTIARLSTAICLGLGFCLTCRWSVRHKQ